MEKTEILRNLGLEDDTIKSGNVGFEIEDLEGYFARTYYEDRLMQGFEVPDERKPDMRSMYERNLYRRTKDLERLEIARTEEDKSQVWPWTDRDQMKWEDHLLERGYGVFDESRVVGAIKEVRTLSREESKEIFKSRWLAAKIIKK